MKRVLLLILATAMLFAVQVVPVFAEDAYLSYKLTAEDEKRLMEVDIIDGPFLLTNEEYKEKVPNYSIYIVAAKGFMELHENYNYKDISTEAGRKEFEAGLSKYNPDPEELQEKINNDKISYIISHKIIQESVFVTNDNCIFKNGNRQTTVRGVLYFTILETDDAPGEYEKGIEYKLDVEVYLSGSPHYTEPEQAQVMGYYPLSKSSAVTPSALTYSASPTNSKVLVNGKAVSFEAYNINGSNYFKLRDLAMAINGTEKQFEVIWDGAKNAINLATNKAYTATGGELTVSANLTVKEAKLITSKVYVDDEEVSFTAYNIGGSNYFKLRDLAKVIDLGVTWDENTHTIGIDTSTVYTE